VWLIYSLMFAVLACWLLAERRACAQLHQEKMALFERLSEAAETLAQNQRSPDLAVTAGNDLAGSDGPLAASPISADVELLRLRREVAGLLRRHQEAESLREDTRQTRSTMAERRKADRAARRAARGDGSRLEIVKAEYWTENVRMEVTDELEDRIRGNALKAMVGNKIKGDPEFGKPKRLTIAYKMDGVMRTNEFREGEPVIIP
jgi:hypothetical protein